MRFWGIPSDTPLLRLPGSNLPEQDPTAPLLNRRRAAVKSESNLMTRSSERQFTGSSGAAALPPQLNGAARDGCEMQQKGVMPYEG